MAKRSEIRIRDPFIYTDRANGCYYMYGTTSMVDGDIAAGTTFAVYKSFDLENFEGPKVIVDGEKLGLWADRDFWAAEMHEYKGKYYLFGSCKAENKCRGTQIFVCDTPDGDFVPVSDVPATPLDWECLDGTLWTYDGVPYMVFCHEWLQVKDGEICAIRLSDDLSRSIGEPTVLFKASDEPMTIGRNGNYVSDGPFLYSEGDKLKMIWSSFGEKGYMVLEASADSLFGKWEHHGSRFDFDGGHAMLFTTLEGRRMISLHHPNNPLDSERAVFFEY